MVTSGVAQGSFSGSLLVLVYIDDMLSLPEFSSCFCFADDTKLACAGEDLFNKCQEDLDKLFTWAADNDLTFNVDKYMYLQVSEKCNMGLSIGSNLIRKIDQTNDLGIEISINLKWSIHVRTKLAKAQRTLIIFNMLYLSAYRTASSIIFILPVFCYFCFMDRKLGLLILAILDN